MYQLTGLPGWIRFGYSPGWVGRSATGLPPTAQWLMSSGQLPQYMEQLRAATPYSMPFPGVAPTKEQEKEMLEQQVKAIESQLQAIRKRIEEIESGKAKDFSPVSSPQLELAALEEYRKQLDEEIKGVEARIEELRKTKTQKSE